MKSESKILNLHSRIADNLPYGLIVSDKNGKFILWNAKALPVFGTENIKSEQQNWVKDFGVYTVDTKEPYKTEDLPMSRALKGETVTNEKMFIQHKGIPEGIYLKINAFPLFKNNKSDEVEAGIIIFDDITKEQLLYDQVVSKINELEDYITNKMGIDIEDIRKHKVIVDRINELENDQIL